MIDWCISARVQIFALGFVSVYEQILESLSAEERGAIFKAYVDALGEDADKYKRDASALEQAANGLTPESLTPNADGNEVQVRVYAGCVRGLGHQARGCSQSTRG